MALKRCFRSISETVKDVIIYNIRIREGKPYPGDRKGDLRYR